MRKKRKTIVAVLLLLVALPVLAQKAERSISTIYDGLSTLSCGERRVAYHGYSREQQLELWTLHLQKFLAAQKLTDPQRTLVLEGLDMISSGALDRIHDPATTSLVKSFKERALRQFDQETFKDAFVRLGGRPNRAIKAGRVERVRSQLQPYCDCDGEADCGGGNCNYFRPCSEIIACGPFGMDWCLGGCD